MNLSITFSEIILSTLDLTLFVVIPIVLAIFL
jgi:hypothetical protein